MDNALPVGILMLDTEFPRILGDIGHPGSFKYPVIYKTVAGASPQKIVREDANLHYEAFLAAAFDLISQGARVISTSCGFLGLFQKDLESVLPVPVVTSSLIQIASINRALPSGKRAGILTISGSSITQSLLDSCDVEAGTPIASTEGGHTFTASILENRKEFDPELARIDNIDAAQRLVSEHQEVGAIVLECTNMPPYATSIRDATGVPVYSILDAIDNIALNANDETDWRVN